MASLSSARLSSQSATLKRVDSGRTDLDDLARQLREHGGEAHVRALLVATDDGWLVYHLWALVGAEPPDWQETAWRYEQLCFVACQVPVANLTSVCSTDVGTGGMHQPEVPERRRSAPALADQPLDAGQADAVHLGQLPFRRTRAKRIQQRVNILSESRSETCHGWRASFFLSRFFIAVRLNPYSSARIRFGVPCSNRLTMAPTSLLAR